MVAASLQLPATREPQKGTERGRAGAGRQGTMQPPNLDQASVLEVIEPCLMLQPYSFPRSF